MATGAIVIGRDYGALGVIRSLGRQGIPVWLLEEAPSNASVSRYLEIHRPWPEGEEAQLRCLSDLAEQELLAGWTLFPASDESVALIARHHAALSERFRLTTPPWDTLRWVNDKRLTHELAERAGVAAPRTVYPRDRADLEAREWTFPVVIKPAIEPDANVPGAAKTRRVENREELLARYDEACALVDPTTILVQELITGGEAQFSYVALCADGWPMVWTVARRRRQDPIDGGKESTFVETVECPEILKPSRKLLAEMRYSGLVEIEYQRDPRNGVLNLLDINGRIWAWHSLGGKAGVDFPFLQWTLANGGRVMPARGRIGVRWMRGLTDLPAAFRSMRAGMLSPLAYLGSFRPPLAFALFAWDDPLPWLADAPLRARQRRAATVAPAVVNAVAD